LDRRLGVGGQVWGHFDADEPVAAVHAVIHRTKHIRRIADVVEN